MRPTTRLTIVGALVVVVVAASIAVVIWFGTSAPANAAQIASRNCQLVLSSYPSRETGGAAKVQGAYASTFRQVEAWEQEHRWNDHFASNGFSRFRRDVVTVCFLSGVDLPSRAPTDIRSEIVVVFQTGRSVTDQEGFLPTVEASPPGTTQRVPLALSTYVAFH
jgi:hypothetical protein